MSSQELAETGDEAGGGGCVQLPPISTKRPNDLMDGTGTLTLEAERPFVGHGPGPIPPRSTNISSEVLVDGAGIPGSVSPNPVGHSKHRRGGKGNPSTPEMPEGYDGLAPVSLVVNEAGHAATRRAHVSVEPPRTGEEEEQKVDSDSGGVVGEDRLSGDDFLNSAGPLSGYDQDFPPLSSSENTSAVDFHSAPAESSTQNDVGHDEASKNAKSKASASKMDNSKASASKSDNSKAQGSKKDAPKGQAAKTAAPNQPKVAKYRDATPWMTTILPNARLWPMLLMLGQIAHGICNVRPSARHQVLQTPDEFAVRQVQRLHFAWIQRAWLEDLTDHLWCRDGVAINHVELVQQHFNVSLLRHRDNVALDVHFGYRGST
ncbi:Aste57867_6571 [Aphanomyces stellatus]|uniref:Aste57867_6571 protein n=1 Tax=Aphanomyces stellatus TaxID=120398 RepID=A0A485KEC7_9STRA|nr:hypothetical protein As57867_006554 [Aphanomyces stellatus]VFT83552.1 Aste57867_6571 [Aphanomyces stellatus]